MPTAHAKAAAPAPLLRKGDVSDLDALCEIERTAFTTDHISRSGLRRMLASPTADVIVAEQRWPCSPACDRAVPAGERGWRGSIRSRSPRAWADAGSAPMLLAAAEAAALARDCRAFGWKCTRPTTPPSPATARAATASSAAQPRYYQDGGDALRFEKRLSAAHCRRLTRGAGLFPPDHRVHLRSGLHHDGAGLGRPVVQAERRPSSSSSGARPPPSS